MRKKNQIFKYYAISFKKLMRIIYKLLINKISFNLVKNQKKIKKSINCNW